MTHSYLRCSIPTKANSALLKLEDCIAEARIWMQKNKLKLNDNKTKFLVIKSKQANQVLDITHLTVGDAHIPAVSCARNNCWLINI